MSVQGKTDNWQAAGCCGESLLRCVDCEAQVCGKCLVACPVGNRCRACARPTAQPGAGRKSAVNWKVVLGALFLGGMYAYLHNSADFQFFQFIFWFVFIFAGYSAGQCLRRGSSDRLEFLSVCAFVLGEGAGYAALCFLLGVPLSNWLPSLLPFWIDAGIFALGFLVGRLSGG